MTQPNPATVVTPELAVTTDIAEYRPIAKALHDLYTRHAGVIHDVTTPKGMQACREARAEIRTCRTSLEAKRKEIKAPALERCRLIDADAKRITDALVAIEDPLDEQIKAEEEAIEARREAKRRAEMERQAELRRMVESINEWPLLCLALTADGIRKAIAGYERTDVPSEPEIPPHYAAEAAGAKVRALDKLREMVAAREAREAEDARLAAERARELERQAAEDKRLRKERQRLEAERQANEARAAEERAELDRQQAEHARIERELADERARINDERVERELAAHPPPGTWPEPSGTPLPSIPPEPYEPCEPFDPSEPRVSQVQAAGIQFPNAEPGTTVMRVRFEKRGGHYHCRVFTAPRLGVTFAKNGDLVFDEPEWPDIRLLMRGAEFIEEETVCP